MPDDGIVRPLAAIDAEEAMALTRRVFSVFVAPGYSWEGIREFENYIRPAGIRQQMAEGALLLWGYYSPAKQKDPVAAKAQDLLGVIALRPPEHIALLFVDPAHHRKGIAAALFGELLRHCRAQTAGENAGEPFVTQLTVNSSPYAVPAYARLGFAATGEEKTVNGIRFVPMARPL